uniref:Uncharacterized protein n=1 Tax=Panagrolaimus sp. JU765 TaxID=591449 RepID=A0AC34RGC5_9BILA
MGYPDPSGSVRVALKNYDNVVFHVVFSVGLENSINLLKILRLFEFDVEDVTLENFCELPKGYEALMTPNVTAASFVFCDIKIDTLLNLMPNIKNLDFGPNPESDWEDFFDCKYLPNAVCIKTLKIKNWKKVSEFLKRQGKGFHGSICGLNDYEIYQAKKYFKVINFKKDPQELNGNFIRCCRKYRLYCKDLNLENGEVVSS